MSGILSLFWYAISHCENTKCAVSCRRCRGRRTWLFVTVSKRERDTGVIRSTTFIICLIKRYLLHCSINSLRANLIGDLGMLGRMPKVGVAGVMVTAMIDWNMSFVYNSHFCLSYLSSRFFRQSIIS